MNKRPIDQARDADLRFTLAAIKRSALRARELAIQTGTRLVVQCDGMVQTLEPDQVESGECTLPQQLHPAAVDKFRPGRAGS